MYARTEAQQTRNFRFDFSLANQPTLKQHERVHCADFAHIEIRMDFRAAVHAELWE